MCLNLIKTFKLKVNEKAQVEIKKGVTCGPGDSQIDSDLKT